MSATAEGEAGMGREGKPTAEEDYADAGNFFFTPQGGFPMDYFGESTRGDLLPHKGFMDHCDILNPDDVK